MTDQKPPVLLVVFIALSMFSSAFMHAIMGVTLPAMGQELGASGVELGLAESVFIGTAAALLLPIGRLADATDKNTLFKGGLLALGFVTFAIGFQPNIESIIAVRFVQGIAAALITATSMAIVADVAPRDRLGQMLGLAIGGTYVGLSSGPFFAGIITTHFGWRWVFFLAAVPPLTSYLLSLATLKSQWRRPVKTVNLTSSALLFAAVMVFIAGAAMLKEGQAGTILVAVSLCLGAAFFAAERRAQDPLLEIGKVVANRALSQALSVQFLIYCGTIGTTFLLSLYLQLIRGHTPETAGQILILGPVVMAVFAPFAGRIADRVSPGRLSALGAVSILCSVTLAAFISSATGIGLVIAIMVFQGLGFALFSAPNIALIMNSVGPGDRGLASALTAVMRSLGMVISMFVVTALIALGLGDGAIADHQDEYLSAMRWTFIIFAVLTAAGAALAGMRNK
jgi:MFS family permease